LPFGQTQAMTLAYSANGRLRARNPRCCRLPRLWSAPLQHRQLGVVGVGIDRVDRKQACGFCGAVALPLTIAG
jgi:hypothetical protein